MRSRTWRKYVVAASEKGGTEVAINSTQQMGSTTMPQSQAAGWQDDILLDYIVWVSGWIEYRGFLRYLVGLSRVVLEESGK